MLNNYEYGPESQTNLRRVPMIREGGIIGFSGSERLNKFVLFSPQFVDLAAHIGMRLGNAMTLGRILCKFH